MNKNRGIGSNEETIEIKRRDQEEQKERNQTDKQTDFETDE